MMTTTTITLDPTRSLTRETQTVLGLLEGLKHGRLDLRLPDGGERLFGHGQPTASLTVHDEKAFRRALEAGDIGFAEAYLDGQWDSPDVTALLTLLANNREIIGKALYGHWKTLLFARLRHWLNANNRAGSKRNIMAHYDLGNDFYARWLDSSMTYSSALFERPEMTLAEAQAAKNQRIFNRLGASPGDSVLEIGCGWGGFAELAVENGLAHTGLTLSPAQLAWAERRVPGADLRLMDYRDLNQRYDHIVSIEMFEAVGERWWPAYFSTLARSLKPGGKAVVQSIVIRDDLFATYRRGSDFIQQYIFPGGMLPSPAVFEKTAAKAGLKVSDRFAFGADYARTLHHWRESFEAAWPDIAASGFDERFRRLWNLYLSYCEAGFRAGSIDVIQFELQHA